MCVCVYICMCVCVCVCIGSTLSPQGTTAVCVAAILGARD